MCPMPARDGCSEASSCSLGWSVRCPEGGGNGDAWWWVWGSSCGFPPPQEATASRRSRSVVAATPRAASATSVTLLDSVSARLVPTPALHEAPNRGRDGRPAFPAALPLGLSLCPCPLSSRGPSLPHCSRPPGKSGSIRWELGPRPRGAAEAPPDPQKWLGRLASKAASHARDPSRLPAPAFRSVLQAQVEGLTCSQCRPHHFHLSASNPDGCLPCFCMGVTQQCASSSYTRHLVRVPDAPLARGASCLPLPAHPWGQAGEAPGPAASPIPVPVPSSLPT